MDPGPDPSPRSPEPSPIAPLLERRRAFHGFLARRLGDPDLAEDVLQEALRRALTGAPSPSDEAGTVAWFYRVLRNAVIDQHRRRGAAERRLKAYADRLAAAPEADAADRRELCRCFLPLLEDLKPEYAQALRRVDLAGAPVSAYAAEADITPNNAAVRLHRARKALRRKLDELCRTCAAHGCLDCSCGSPPAP